MDFLFGDFRVLLILLKRMSQISALGFEKPYYRRKNLLVVGGTRTRVLVDSMYIAARALTIAPSRLVMIVLLCLTLLKFIYFRDVK